MAVEKIVPFTESLGGELEAITAFFNFTEQSPVARLIHTFKYDYASSIGSIWQQVVENSEVKWPAGFVFMPVPLFVHRERERGYNQAAILAGIFSSFSGLPYSTSHLVRTKKTAQQAKLNRQERFDNVAGAFDWISLARVPERVLLVDDVFTTGATMRECAKALKIAGAKEVRGVVLARG